MTKNGPFQKKKVGQNKNPFNFREIKWLKFDKRLGYVYFKNSLEADQPFFEIDFMKKTKISTYTADIPQVYDKPLPISMLKKENLFSILPQIDKDAREFYENLDTAEMPDIDPDLD